MSMVHATWGDLRLCCAASALYGAIRSGSLEFLGRSMWAKCEVECTIRCVCDGALRLTRKCPPWQRAFIDGQFDDCQAILYVSC